MAFVGECVRVYALVCVVHLVCVCVRVCVIHRRWV